MNITFLKAELESFLIDYFKERGTYNKKIYEAMAYSINIGGKRIRPILMLLTYSLYKDDYKEILPIASAMEMIHTYSLIHDDLPCMDNDDLRRGRPTNHKVFGEHLAVLAGDALLNEAMDIMFKFCLNKGINAIRACSAIAHSSSADGMIGGQVVDILSEGKDITADELLYMHHKKTGELIKASILAGVILGEGSDEDEKLLEEYGEKLGLAFQVKDDILDVTGDKKMLGKTVHSDESNNKTNFVSTYGLEECKALCVSLTNECINILDSIPKETKYLKELTSFLLERNY